MVEYALLNGMIALRTIALGAGDFVRWVNWPIVGVFAAGALLVWWSMAPKGPYR
jgi:hypothetical protein